MGAFYWRWEEKGGKPRTAARESYVVLNSKQVNKLIKVYFRSSCISSCFPHVYEVVVVDVLCRERETIGAQLSNCPIGRPGGTTCSTSFALSWA